MKLSAHKGIIVIEGTEQEESRIEAVAAKMVEISSEANSSDMVLDDSGLDGCEYFATIAYATGYITVKEVREIYKEAKAA